MKLNRFPLILSIILIFTFILACDNDKKDSADSKNDKKTTETKTDTNKKIDKTDEEEEKKIILDEEYFSETTKVQMRDDDNKMIELVIDKKDIVVKINQIDTVPWPNVKLYVSLTDKEGKPIRLINPKLFSVKENGELRGIKDIRQHQNTKDSEKTPLNIILAIDKSGSMSWDDRKRVLPVKDQPITYAKNAAVTFIENLDVLQDNCEIVAFDHELYDLGINNQAIRDIMELTADGDTALYGTLYKSVQKLTKKDGAKAVILLTDGKNDVVRVKNAELKNMSLDKGISLADELSIPVFTIGFGKFVDRGNLENYCPQNS